MTPEEKLVVEGGKVKILTQARQLDAAHESGVIVDYLRFTIKRSSIPDSRGIPPDTDNQNLARLLAMQFASLLGFFLGADRPGRDYYEFTTTIENEFGHEIGSVSAGGDGQRETICFTLKGEGCTHARQGWEKRVHAAFGEYLPKITRIDLARDFYDGEVCIEEVVGAYKDHAFSYQKRLPSYTQYGCWTDMRGPQNSRTFQIGKRESGKLFRAYEKGHQFKIMDSKWLRCEVELRSVNRVIPWEAVLRTGEYFAGAYEFCTWVSQHEIAVKVPTQVKTAEHGVQACVNWLRRVVAPTLVQVASALPNFDWLEDLVVAECHRKMPRALRGFNHHTITQGLEKAFRTVHQSALNASVPAAAIA